MSYARWGKDSDIYLYGHDPERQGFECVGCILNRNKEGMGMSLFIYGYNEAIQHVKEHIKVGHDVPDDTIEYLMYDKKEEERSEWKFILDELREIAHFNEEGNMEFYEVRWRKKPFITIYMRRKDELLVCKRRGFKRVIDL